MLNLITLGATVFVGLAIVGAGVVLSWHEKPLAVIWPTYAIGFLLVLMGGPLGGSISSLQFGTEGFEVSFIPLDPDAPQISKIQAVGREVFENRGVTNETVEVEESVSSEVMLTVYDKLESQIDSRGFVATSLVGSHQYQPGSIVYLEGDDLVLWASPDEAFPGLMPVEFELHFPEVHEASSLLDSEATNIEDEVKVAYKFGCKYGVSSKEVSFHSLQTKLNRDVLEDVPSDRQLLVVQSSLLCRGFDLLIDLELESDGSSDAFRYWSKSEDSTVLGIKILSLKIPTE